jgi:hypothetical protein
MKDKPHQLRRLSIRWSSSSNDMPRDGFASNSASRRKASAIPSSSSCRIDGSDPSRCAAGQLSRSPVNPVPVSRLLLWSPFGGSLVSTTSKARTHHKPQRVPRRIPLTQTTGRESVEAAHQPAISCWRQHNVIRCTNRVQKARPDVLRFQKGSWKY